MSDRQRHQAPLAERLKDVLSPEDLREVASIERTATARYVHAGSNGVIKRWWEVAKTISAIGGVVWFLSSEWTTTKQMLVDAARQVAALSAQVKTLEHHTLVLQVQVEDLRNQRAATPARRTEPVRPSFPPDSRFSPSEVTR